MRSPCGGPSACSPSPSSCSRCPDLLGAVGPRRARRPGGGGVRHRARGGSAGRRLLPRARPRVRAGRADAGRLLRLDQRAGHRCRVSSRRPGSPCTPSPSCRRGWSGCWRGRHQRRGRRQCRRVTLGRDEGPPGGMIAGDQYPPTGGAARRVWTILVGLALGLVAALLGPASPASAHAVLVGTSPAQGSVVAGRAEPGRADVHRGRQPDRRQGSGHRAGRRAGRTRTRRGRPAVSSSSRCGSPAARGTYLVTFRVLSADSHPVSRVASPTRSAPRRPAARPRPTSATATRARRSGSLFPVVRWIGYVGLLLLVGAVLILAVLWPQRLDRTGPIRVIWAGAGLIALATVVELVLQVPYVAGGGLGDLRAADVQRGAGQSVRRRAPDPAGRARRRAAAGAAHRRGARVGEPTGCCWPCSARSASPRGRSPATPARRRCPW